METKRYDIFVSFSTEDQKTAEGVCGFLERNGIRCFVSYRDIPKGANWPSSIYNAVKQSKMMVAVFSENFNKSEHTGREITLASQFHIPILTFRIVPDEPTDEKGFFLVNLNWIDAFPEPEKYFGSLLENVKTILGISNNHYHDSNDNIIKPGPNSHSQEIIAPTPDVRENSDANDKPNNNQPPFTDNENIVIPPKPNDGSDSKDSSIITYVRKYWIFIGLCVIIAGLATAILNLPRRCQKPMIIYEVDTLVVKDTVVQDTQEPSNETPVTQEMPKQVPDEVKEEENATGDIIYQLPKNVKDLKKQLTLKPKEESIDKTMLSKMQQLAKQGNAEAQFWMGNYYFPIKEKGQYKNAKTWWEKSAKQKYVKAMNRIAQCHYEGTFYKINYGEAVKWYLISAQKNDPEAMYELGLCYYSGHYQGDKREKMDFNKAKEWLRKAVSQNYAPAQRVWGKLLYRNDFGYSKPHYDEAFFYFLEASRKGDPEAQYYLGLCYKEGRGTKANNSMYKYCVDFAKKNGYIIPPK